jgi:two-component system alkaline phosphatase synthesis response regulator PhoP
VDDEPNIIQLARMYLERAGYRVEAASNGRSAIEMAERLQPALIVLDIMLPELDGLEVCKNLRTSDNQVPVIMLTARDEDIDKIIGLELGADDYLTKPFNPHELVARIKAILRRMQQVADHSPHPIHLGGLLIDPGSREVRVNGRLVEFRTQEFEVLWVLLEHKSIVLTREKLLAMAWGYDYAGETRTVDVHIGQIRRKIVNSQVRIDTVTGVGYKLVIGGK